MKAVLLLTLFAILAGVSNGMPASTESLVYNVEDMVEENVIIEDLECKFKEKLLLKIRPKYKEMFKLSGEIVESSNNHHVGDFKISFEYLGIEFIAKQAISNNIDFDVDLWYHNFEYHFENVREAWGKVEILLENSIFENITQQSEDSSFKRMVKICFNPPQEYQADLLEHSVHRVSSKDQMFLKIERIQIDGFREEKNPSDKYKPLAYAGVDDLKGYANMLYHNQKSFELRFKMNFLKDETFMRELHILLLFCLSAIIVTGFAFCIALKYTAAARRHARIEMNQLSSRVQNNNSKPAGSETLPTSSRASTSTAEEKLIS